MALADIIAETRRILEQEPWEDAINDAAGINASVTSVTVDSSAGWFEGDTMEFQDAGEQAYVETDAAASSVTIKRAHNGTTAATHNDNVVLVKLKPDTYSFIQIEKAIDQVIDTLWPDVYDVSTQSITPAITTTAAYNLATTFMEVLDAVQVATGSLTDWVDVPIRDIKTNLPTATWASGKAIRFASFPGGTSNAVTLTYKALVTTATSDTQIRRITALGAAALLLDAHTGRLGPNEEARALDLRAGAQSMRERYEEARAAYRAELFTRYGISGNFIKTRRVRKR